MEVGKVYVDILPDTSRFGRQLHSDLTRSTRNLDSSMKSRFASIGKTAGLALLSGIGTAAAGLAVLGKASVDAAMEAQKIQAQTNAVLASTKGAANIGAQGVANLADKLSFMSGIDDELIQSSSNLLLTFRNIRNEVGKGNAIFNRATSTVLDMSVALGQDTKSSAIQLGKALNDPIAGVSALSRVGVTFSESQKRVIERLVESGELMTAQKAILKELGLEFGGSARAAGATFAGAMDRAKVAVGNVLESIGKALLPILTRLAKRFATFVESDKFQQWLVVVRKDLHRLGPRIEDAIGKVDDFGRALFTGENDLNRFAVSVNQAGRDVHNSLDNLAGWFNELGRDLHSELGKLPGMMADAWNRASENVRRIAGDLLDFVKRLPSRVFSALGNLDDFLFAKGKDLMGGFFAGVRSGITDINLPSIDLNPFGDGSGIQVSGPAGTPTSMFQSLAAAVPGPQSISSGYRPGAITSSGNPSLHSIAPPWNAVDIVGANLLQLAQAAAATYGPKLRELIYTPLGYSIKNGARTSPIAASDHYDHIHLADRGAVFREPTLALMAQDARARPEIATPEALLRQILREERPSGGFRLDGRIKITNWKDGSGYFEGVVEQEENATRRYDRSRARVQ